MLQRQISLPLPRSKIKTVFVSRSKRCHLTLGIFCSHSRNCCKFCVQALLLHLSLPVLGGQALQNHISSLRKNVSSLPPDRPWPNNCQSSWMPNRALPRLPLLVLLVLLISVQIPSCPSLQRYLPLPSFMISERFLHQAPLLSLQVHLSSTHHGHRAATSCSAIFHSSRPLCSDSRPTLHTWQHQTPDSRCRGLGRFMEPSF